MCGKAALRAAELTRMAVFVTRTLSYWFLNCYGLFCACLCLLVLWELRMCLLNKGTDLCSGNTLLTFWNLRVYVFCILWTFFLRVGVLFLPCPVTGVDTLFPALTNVLYLGLFLSSSTETLLDDFLLTYTVFMTTDDLCQALLRQYPFIECCIHRGHTLTRRFIYCWALYQSYMPGFATDA